MTTIVLFPSSAARAQQPAAPAAKPETKQTAAEQPSQPDKPAAEPKLKFNFRFQRWADVLEWFAQQSDLSLVLDAPPPGTFNYSDNREYTPAEAIDLLNGVLLTKGYTLLRRDHMLLVVNLADGLPPGSVPRVALDELDRRGKYEFVSVLFPLGKRSAEEVNKEIAPLLGTHGKSVPLPTTRQLLVIDTAGVMRAIHAVIESIPEPAQPAAASPQIAPQLATYPVKTADAATTLEVLRTLLPDAKFALDPKTDQISAFALPAQQPVIKSVIDQMQSDHPPDKQPRLEVHAVQGADQQLIATLQPIAPGARLSADPAGGKLVIWATPVEQEAIREALKRLDRAPSPENTRQLEVYPLTKAEPSATLALVQTLAPAARVALDSQTRSLVALATPGEHTTIRETLARLQPEKPGPDAPELRFYPQADPPASGLLSVLQSLAPKAQVTFDATGRRLMVLASPADQQVISTTLERVAKSDVAPEQRVLTVYPLKTADTPNFLQLLDPTVQQNARIVPDAKRDVLIVWARPKDQEAIGKALEDFQRKLPEGQERVSKVYRFRWADPSTALSVLGTLVPGAQMAVDPRTRGLVINALPDDHAKIKSTITEIDREDTDREAPVLKAHRVVTADSATVLSTLQTLFAARPEVRLSLDAVNNQVIALASPAQHDTIQAVIAEVEKGIPSEAGARLEVYPLSGIDANNAMQVLNALLAKRAAKVRLSLDARGRQLVAIAPVEEQTTIRETLARLQTAEPVLEVFQLDVVEPFAAASAIDKLFSTEGGAKRSDAPNVESDAAAQRLLVRATKEQLAQIRELLVKMGETHLAQQSSTARAVRVIPFHGDAQAAVAEIRRVWPQLRGNPVRVVVPSAVLPTLRGRTFSQPEKAPPAAKPEAAPPSPEIAPEKKPEEKSPPQSSSNKPHQAWHALRRQGRGLSDRRVSETFDRRQLIQWVADGRSKVSDTVSTPYMPQGVPPIVPCAFCAAADDGAESSDDTQPKPAEQLKQVPQPAPVVISVSEDTITIASDDPAALDEMEALVRSIAQRAGAPGHDLTVFLLKNANARTVAATLTDLYKSDPFLSQGRGAVTIVADERINAVVVHANRADRKAIENLLEVLDTTEVPEALVGNKPRTIPVKNTRATVIERVIRDVYKTQLTSGGGRHPIPVPSGVSAETAAVIQQINAAASGPVMTVGVDDSTNSIVVMAPTSLANEVAQLVQSLDAAAIDDPSRSVRLVPLKRANATRVQQTLDVLIKDALRRERAATTPR